MIYHFCDVVSSTLCYFMLYTIIYHRFNNERLNINHQFTFKSPKLKKFGDWDKPYLVLSRILGPSLLQGGWDIFSVQYP